MSKRILAAIDLSAASFEALREAHALAVAEKAALAVCHVLPERRSASSLFSSETDAEKQARAEVVSRGRSALEERVRGVIDGDFECFVEHGSDYAEIIRRAEAWSADLVVVGSQGRSGLSRLVLGSVAERVVQYAHCPVLIVRRAGAQGSVLVGTDLSDLARPAIAAGAAEARRTGSRLIVAHAFDLSEAAWDAGVGNLLGATAVLPPPEVQQQMRDALNTTLRQAVTQAGVNADAVVLEGAPAGAVVRYAGEIGARLLVIGTHGRTGLARVALGSVADRILRAAECSVLVVRQAH
jgi:nucleotide-binding universal stress UspA family protein